MPGRAGAGSSRRGTPTARQAITIDDLCASPGVGLHFRHEFLLQHWHELLVQHGQE